MADTLTFNLKNNTNLQLITYTILHDISLICSIIISHPLYSFYFIFFSRYFIKLISFISPLFIATVFLSLLLTTTTAFCPNLPQLELGILQTVIQELKSNLDEVNAYEKDRNFEDFEICKIVFDSTLSIGDGERSVSGGWRNDVKPIYYSDLDELGVIEKTTESSVHGCRRNDVTTSDSDKLDVEKTPDGSVYGGRRNDVTISDSVFKKLGVEKTPESTGHSSRRNDVTDNDSDSEKLDVEKLPKSSVHGSRRNDVKISNSDYEKLGVEKLLETSVHGGQRNDVTVGDSDTDKLGFEKITENSVHGGRRNNVTLIVLGFEKLGVEKTPERSVHVGRRNVDRIKYSDTDKLGVKKITENSAHGGRRNDVTSSVSGFEKTGFEKLSETSVHGVRRNDVTTTDSCVDESNNEKSVEKLLEELDRFEDFTTATETETDSDEVIGSAAINSNDKDKDNDKHSENSVKSSSWRSNYSMKEEKEWRRTLACKLFEERYNSRGGEEGMDSLWEDYECDDSTDQKEVMINNRNGGIARIEDEDTDEDEDEDEDGDVGMRSGHLCCLQALKLSTRNMNLGMGKHNLVKITKALKGFGWLHQVKSKHGKKSLGSFMG
ncbi:hypothetical protein Hanom_Chr01g00009391 [Helianthus anomalus]